MHQCIVKSIIATKTTHNFTHIDTSTTKNTEINAIISTKLANYTLSLFIIKVPRRTVAIHITFKISIRSTSKRVEKVYTLTLDVDSDPVTTGFVRRIRIATTVMVASGAAANFNARRTLP